MDARQEGGERMSKKVKNKAAKKILRKQMKLLAEISRTADGPNYLMRLSAAMRKIAKLL